LKVILLRTYLALLGAVQKWYIANGGKRNKDNPADPYMTLLGYFNSLRELGGSRRIVEDEVSTRLSGYANRKREDETDGPFAERKIAYEVVELTSRVSADKVAEAKRRLAVPFHDDERVDVAIATNMISVGLDITRLGLNRCRRGRSISPPAPSGGPARGDNCMPKPNARPHGQVRHSQVVTTFGPGLLLDLPTQSVLVVGLDHWSGVSEEVHEPRLVEKLKRLLNTPTLKLFSPPPDNEDPAAPRTGIAAWQFPEWLITQDVETVGRGRMTRSRLLVHRRALTKGKFIDQDKKKHPVVPIRFVRACRKGHIGDIDWYRFVHEKNPQCRRQLWIEERGTSGDISEIFVRCECGEGSPLVRATIPGTLGHCDGARPWLGPYTKEVCDDINRLLVRHASNAYFPQIMSVISLPDRSESLEKAINQVWENFLQYVDTLDELRKDRQKKPPVKAALEGFTDEEVFQEVEARKGTGNEAPIKSVKQAEFEVLTTTKEEVGQDTPDGDFFARALPKAAWDKPWMASTARIVLVHRLREVVAQLGFTKFEAITPDVEGELQMGVQAAPLARELSWLPAVENRGEGIFLQFRKPAIDEWLARSQVQERGKRLLAGFESWQRQHPQSHRHFPGLPYFLLHSLSHLLLTAVSLVRLPGQLDS
jgi:hypothetical protein